MPGVSPVIVAEDVLLVVFTKLSLWLVWMLGRIQKPRWFIIAPLVPVIVPITKKGCCTPQQYATAFFIKATRECQRSQR